VTVAFDFATESIRTATTDPWTFSHTPAGTPRAVVVALINYTSSTDQIAGVTYGGVALAKIKENVDTSGEQTNTQLWFLGTGIPTGAQTVSVDLTSATGDDFMMCCLTFTGAANCFVKDTDGISEDIQNPQVTLQYGGKSCLSVCALGGGLSNVTDYTLVASMSAVHDNDSGNEIQRVDRQTTAGTSDFTIGYTAGSSDDVSFAALAISDQHTTTAVGLAEETDTALAATTKKTLATGLSSETDTALAATAERTYTVGLASETDEGLPLSTGQTIAVGQAQETDTGLAATAERTYTVGFAEETDTGLAAVAEKTVVVGLAEETDTGLAATTKKILATGLAEETDTGLAAVAEKTAVVGLAEETDTGLAAVAEKTAVVGLAEETDTGLATTSKKTSTTGLVEETDTGLAITAEHGYTVGYAEEVDSPFSVSAGKLVAIALALETDDALALQSNQFIQVNQATEVDAAQLLTVLKVVTVGQSTETDSALAATAEKIVAVGLAEEVDSTFGATVVMAVVSDVVRVQNALVSAAMSGLFYKRQYDKDTKLVTLGASVLPAEALVNETSSTFVVGSNRRRLVRQRATWTFDLILGFNVEVTCEAFEQRLLDKPIRVKVVKLPDVQLQRYASIILELVSAAPTHPVQQNGTRGTRVTYTFQARMRPA
jgi:hypothetical protein